jgi:hypothetical protein
MNSEDKVHTASDAPAVDEAPQHLDLPDHLRPVALKYGRDMFALVFDAGMCSQATQVLATLANKHMSKSGIHAVQVLASAFNEISTAYAKSKGWDEAVLAQCDRDIQLAFQGKVQVPGQSIILDS